MPVSHTPLQPATVRQRNRARNVMLLVITIHIGIRKYISGHPVIIQQKLCGIEVSTFHDTDSRFVLETSN